MAQLYCIQCAGEIEYSGRGEYVCPRCGYVSCFDHISEDMLELHAKAQWYQIDGQYFNALQMYEIIAKEDEQSYSVHYGALLAEFGVRYVDLHDGSYNMMCDRTQMHSVYDSEHYRSLAATAPEEVMSRLTPLIERINGEQIKNRDRYLASAPVEEAKDYRAEARKEDPDSVLADDYLSAREKYLAREREEQEEAERTAQRTTAVAKPQQQRTHDTSKRKLSFKEQRELEEIECDLSSLTQERATLEEELSAGNADYNRLTELSQRIEEIIALIDEKEMRWLELNE